MDTKFKAWVSKYSQMFEVSVLDLTSKFPVVKLHEFENKEFTIDEVDIIQNTGLIDLNEKEIWEGDIVELHNPNETPVGHLSIVIVNNKKGPLVSRHPIHIKNNPKEGPSRKLSDYINSENEDNIICRVIGNVFENPEYDLILLAEKHYNNLMYSESDMKIN